MKPSGLKQVWLGLFMTIFFISPVFALTPPWTQEMLDKESDAIVEGTVEGQIQCLGQVEQNKCSDKLKFSTTLKVKSSSKGALKAGQSIKIIFYYLDYQKSNCVGDQYAVLHSGEEGTYYLKKNDVDSYSPVHWSGVKATKKSAEALPRCP